MKRLRGWVATPLGIGGMWVLLLGMVALGADVGGFLGIHPFDSSTLDYSAPPLGGFEPLRDPLVASVLGDRIPAAPILNHQPASPGWTPHAEVVTHGLTNDAEAQAYDIESVPFTGRSDTTGSTREQADPASCVSKGPTVWYRYRPEVDGTLVATTVAAYADSLGVFVAPASGDTHALGCDSDANGLSRVAFSAFAGTTYLFQITAKQTGGKLEFSLEPPHRATLVSGAHAGPNGADYDFGYPKISADGRYVVFEADPSLSLLDRRCALRADGSRPCGFEQSFIKDLRSGTIALVSLTSTGGVPDQDSLEPWISADGRYVTFSTRAEGVTADPDRKDSMTGDFEFDTFRRDRLLGTTERVTMSADGHELNGAGGSMSDDGRLVAFAGDFEHRINAEHPNYPIADIYIKDMDTGRVTLASVGNRGQRGDHDSIAPQLSPDGGYVAFWTRATNFSFGSTPVDDVENPAGVFQGRVYVDDLRHHHLSFECVPQGKSWSLDHCYGPSISRDGRYSLFWSDARDLVRGAPTGGTPFHPIMNLYLRDRRTGHLEIINVTDNGTPVGDVGEQQFGLVRAGRLYRPWVSADGSVVAFDANAALAPGDRNGLVDAYVRDRKTGRTIRVSETPSGGDPNDQSVFPYPTGDGSTVAFLSLATNLTQGAPPGWNMYVCRWRIE